MTLKAAHVESDLLYSTLQSDQTGFLQRVRPFTFVSDVPRSGCEMKD
jgi:hypothetical protein